jgi:hypothetical protein
MNYLTLYLTLIGTSTYMVERKPLPPQSTLLSLFDYRDNDLYWKSTGELAGSIKSKKDSDYQRRVINVEYQSYIAARLVWKYHHGTDPLYDIDHIDQDPLNNEISNLRDTPHNACNKKKYKSTTGSNYTQEPYISWSEQRSRWRTYINLKSKYFKDLNDAISYRNSLVDVSKFHENHGNIR